MATASPPRDDSQRLHDALVHHLGNRLDEAERLYRAVLERAPMNAQALGMLAMIVSDRPEDDLEAEGLLYRHLALRPADGASLHRLGRLKARQGDDDAAAALFQGAALALPRLAPVFNDLGISLLRLGRPDEALAALDRALALDPAYALAHGNRGVVLFDLGRFDESAEAHLTALALAPPASPHLTSILHDLSKAVRKAGRPAAAEAACAIVEAAAPTEPSAVDEWARLLDDLGRSADARRLRNESARRHRITRRGPGLTAQARLLLLGGVGAGHLPTRYLVDTAQFDTLSIEMLSPDQPDAPLGAVDFDDLKDVDVVFNTMGEGDRHGGQFDAVHALCARLGKPLLNPPDKVRRTTRDQTGVLFGGVADLCVPAVRWASLDDLATMPIDAPLLVRPPGDHGGDNLALLRHDADREAYLLGPRFPADRLLLTEFHDFRSPDGCWRKYRLIFVDPQIYPYHLAIGESWLLHYWRAGMSLEAWKKAEEARFLADWRGVFGERAARAAEDVAVRLDLDYGGMDCALLADGRLLLFEANACMRVHLDEPQAAFPYKHLHVPPIREAFSAMVKARATAAAQIRQAAAVA